MAKQEINMEKSNKILWIIGVVIAIIILGLLTNGFGFFSPTGQVTNEPFTGDVSALAEHLGNTAVLYYSDSCPHCHTQMAMFGTDVDKLNKINVQETPVENLEGVPAWKINGQIYYSVQSLERLAELSGFQ